MDFAIFADILIELHHSTSLSKALEEEQDMGSSGSGRLSDYPGSKKPGGGGGSGGGPGGQDRCTRAIDTKLEDVEHCEHFVKHKRVPPVGAALKIAFKNKRVVALTDANEVVGNLPTKFNYLVDCMNDGFAYIGRVRGSNNGPPEASVTADFAPA
jgi:hypothetical protein